MPQPITPSLGLRRLPALNRSLCRGSSTVLLKVSPARLPAGVGRARRPTKVAASRASTSAVEPSSAERPRRQRVVVLGSGWGCISFIKGLPRNISEKLELTVISPRNYFLFTALLPAVATGNIEARSVSEGLRKVLGGKGTFYEARALDIDPESRTVSAAFEERAGLKGQSFTVPYDSLIVSVGSVDNTFGIQGVREHCFLFKSISDALGLKERLAECFERAALPGTTDQERAQLLSFVVCGGGPTGVEVAAEIHDLISEDLVKYYPKELVSIARVRLIELQDHLLSTYDRSISDYTSQLFSRNGVNLILNSKVESVESGKVTVKDSAGYHDVPFGACVWATGVAMHPLVKQLQQKLEASAPGTQTHFRSIVVDSLLRVNGSGGSIWSLGDAATLDQPRARAHAKELFKQADTDGDGFLSIAELRAVLREASKEYSHLREHALFLDKRKGGQKRFGGLISPTLKKAAKRGAPSATEKTSSGGNGNVLESIDDGCELTEADFTELLEKIDMGLRALPATGQVAGQQGEFLGKLFARHDVRSGADLRSVAPFKYSHQGSVAYVGGDNAVFDLPRLGALTGRGAGALWRGFEVFRQVSARNRALVAADFLKSKLFGRDVELTNRS